MRTAACDGFPDLRAPHPGPTLSLPSGPVWLMGLLGSRRIIRWLCAVHRSWGILGGACPIVEKFRCI